MDYLKNYTEKKDRKKYYPLVLCLDRFTAICHLVCISCLLPLLKWYAGTYCRIIQRPLTPPIQKNWIYHELMLLKGSTQNHLGEFFNIELVSSTWRTVVVKLVLFSYAFRPTVVDFFREFYKCGLQASIYTWYKPYKWYSQMLFT